MSPPLRAGVLRFNALDAARMQPTTSPTLYRSTTVSERENARLVQQAYQSFKTGDIERLLDSLDTDVQWRLPEMANVPFAGKWQGREAVEQFFSTVAQAQDAIEFEPEEFIAQGDKVVALGRFAWRVRATGKQFRADWAHVWTVRRGKVTRFNEYTDTVAAIRAHTAGKTGT
jgi:ketosteroid isomerase-like protein